MRSRFRTRSTLVVTLLVAVVGAAAIPSQALAGAWSTPRTVGTYSGIGLQVQVGVTGDGRQHVIWTQNDGLVRTVSSTADGAWSEPVTLGTYAEVALVVVRRAPNGSLHAFWTARPTPGGTPGVMWSSIGSSGTWSTPQLLSDPGVESGQPDASFGFDGTLTVVWRTITPKSVQSRTRGTSGTWNAIKTVDNDDPDYGSVVVTTGDDGEAHVSYVADPAGTPKVGTRTGVGGGVSWSAETSFGSPAPLLDLATIPLDVGRVAVVWSDPVGGTGGTGDQQIAVYDPVTGWAAPEHLADGVASSTKLVRRGAQLFVLRSVMTLTSATQQAISGAPGNWSAPTNLSTDTFANYGEAFVDATGRLHSVWRGYDSTKSAMRASTLESGASSWGGELTIASRSDLDYALDYGFHAAPDGAGNAVAAWLTQGKQVQFSRYDGVAPSVGTRKVPVSAYVKQSVAASMVATDSEPGTPAPTIRWTFGDGTAPVTGASVTHVFTKPGTYTVATTATDAVGNAVTRTSAIVVRPVNVAVVLQALKKDAAATKAAVQRTRLTKLRRTWSFTAPKIDALTAGTSKVALEVRTGRRTTTLALGTKRFAAGSTSDITVRIPTRMRPRFATGPVTADLVVTFTWTGGSRSVRVPVTLR